MWAAAAYTAMVEAIGAGVGAAHGPLVLKRHLAAASNWAKVCDFMRASGLDKLEVTQRQSVYSMLAELVVARAVSVARAVRAPLTPKFVADRAADIAAIFDLAYPGYLASGLAPMVAARLTQHRPA